MLYDESEGKYLEKKVKVLVVQATLRIKQVDHSGKEVGVVGKIDIDLADLLNNQERYFALEYDFEHNGRDGKLYFDVDFESSKQLLQHKQSTSTKSNQGVKEYTASTQPSGVLPTQKISEPSEDNQLFTEESELRRAALREELQAKNKQISRLEEENDLLKKEIERLMFEQRRSQLKIQSVVATNEKTNAFRKKLELKEAELGLSLDRNKVLADRCEQAERRVRQQSRRIDQLSEDLTTAKERMASLLQECMEQGDTDLIALVQKHYG